MLNHAAPLVNQSITADLPGERVRVVVTEVVSPDMVLGRIPTAPMGKGHTYRIGDVVPFRREQGQLGDTWAAVDEHKLQTEKLAREAAEREATRQRAADAKAKRTAAPKKAKKKHAR